LALNAEYGVELFHAKDIRGRKGSFKGWTARKRGEYNSRFLRIADDYLAYGLSMVVSSEDYECTYKAALFPRKARPDTSYGICVRSALLKSISLLKDRKDDWPLNIVMEAGHRNVGDAIKVFDEIKERLTPKYSGSLGYISFRSKRDCLPLAMADALAYAIFRMTAGYSSHPTMPNAAVVGEAIPPYYVHKIPLSRTQIDKDALIRYRDDMCGR
jgi:hypothetical protein